MPGKAIRRLLSASLRVPGKTADQMQNSENKPCPASIHIIHARRVRTDSPIAADKLNPPECASAPAAISMRFAGIGKHACLPSTEPINSQ